MPGPKGNRHRPPIPATACLPDLHAEEALSEGLFSVTRGTAIHRPAKTDPVSGGLVIAVWLN